MRKGLIASFVCSILGVLLLHREVFASGCGGAETVIINCSSNESPIISVLCLVISIVMATVGLLAAIGITVVGIQYLTAGGNEEQVRKSKKRLYHIVIGLAVYALMVPVTNFLMPGGLFSCTIQDDSDSTNSDVDSGDSNAKKDDEGDNSSQKTTENNVDRPASEIID